MSREEICSLQLPPPWKMRGSVLNYGLGLLSSYFVKYHINTCMAACNMLPLFAKDILVRLQLFRGLAYIHTILGVCHRDVKPQNVYVDPLTHQVKLCDFGSAKVLLLNVWSKLQYQLQKCGIKSA